MRYITLDKKNSTGWTQVPDDRSKRNLSVTPGNNSRNIKRTRISFLLINATQITEKVFVYV